MQRQWQCASVAARAHWKFQTRKAGRVTPLSSRSQVTSEAALPERQTACCGEREVFTRQRGKSVARRLIASDCDFGDAGASIQRRAALRGGLATQRVFTVEKSWKYERSTNQWHCIVIHEPKAQIINRQRFDAVRPHVGSPSPRIPLLQPINRLLHKPLISRTSQWRLPEHPRQIGRFVRRFVRRRFVRRFVRRFGQMSQSDGILTKLSESTDVREGLHRR